MDGPGVGDLTLDQKVGQLFLAGFDGTEPTDALASLVADRHLGNVVYFARNVDSPAQLARLSGDLRARMRGANAGAPPLLAIDQEGGVVSRLDWGTTLPGAMAVGGTDDPDLARRAGAAVGAELATLGVTMNLAPVLDVNYDPDNPVIGVRSFGEDPERVATLGAATARGLQSAGVLACGKHFPGHGDTATDSHRTLPTVEHDRERLERVELPPFTRAIGAGVGAVMTAHVAFPALTGRADLPATLAKPVGTGLLREALGYDGLVVTDCLEMAAVADGVGTAEGAVRAVEAGCDLLTVSHTPDVQRAAMAAVREAVVTERIDVARLDRSVERVLRAKRRYAGAPSPDDWEPAAERCHAVAREVAGRAVTLVRDDGDRLPLSGPVRVVEFAGTGSPTVAGRREHAGDVADALADAGADVTGAVVDAADPLDGLPAVHGAETVVCTDDAVGNPEQVDVIDSLRAAGVDPVILAVRNPYDLRAVGGRTVLTTYDPTRPSLEAAAAVLVGAAPPRGRLPVTAAGPQ
jgi:beta-N-acetylhexosaminidase